MKDQATDKRSPIVIGALTLTAIFLVGFGWLLSRTTTCPEGWWLWDRLGCLEPNALGDTFAGAFAPVAFVWLVAAVLLQRNELAAQRQELRESRGVAAQQVEEARRNVQLIAQQTEMLIVQRKDAEIDSTERQLSEYISLIADVFSRMSGRRILDYDYVPPLGSSFVSLDPRGANSAHHYVKHCIAKLDNEMKDIEVEQLMHVKLRYTHDFADVQQAIFELEELAKQARQVKQLQVANLELERYRSAYRKFLSLRSHSKATIEETTLE